MRALVLVAALAAGCYDVDGLTKSFRTPGDGGSDGSDADAGGAWRTMASPTTAPLHGVAAVGGGEFVAVGAGSTIVRMSATAAPALETTTPGWNLRAVGGGDEGAIAVGDEEIVLTRTGGAWSGVSLGDATLYAVASPVTGETVAVGSSGTIVHRTASGWAVEDSGVAAALHGVVAPAPGELVAVGEGGVIIRGGGGETLTWVADVSGVTADLFAVWSNGSDAWAVGAGGLVLHAAAGGAWNVEASGTSADLLAVTGAGDRVWAVGAGGTIVVRQAGAWSVEHAGGADLHAVAADVSGAWAVGDGGAILSR